jgi:serine/threonine-protein kinase HipA
MRKLNVFVNSNYAADLEETDEKKYVLVYDENYKGLPVSLTMPIQNKIYSFDEFPPFFEGLLPEGRRLEVLLRQTKIDRKDYFSQLLIVGEDLVGDVTVRKAI